MKYEPIGNIVIRVQQGDPAMVGRPWINYLDISSVDNEAKRVVAPQHIATDSAPSRARQFVRANDVLVSTVRPNLNAVAIVPPAYDGEVASTGFCVLRSQPAQLCPSYLFFFTQSAAFVSHLTAVSTGASYPAITDADIMDTLIPLPSLSEQQRIAGQLEQADRMRRARRYALQLSDSFLPAAFLELFGDPRKASTRWESDEFGSLGALDRGRSRNRPRNAPHLYGGPYPFIQTGDVASAQSYIRSHSQTYSEDGLKQSKLWPAGTLCITIAANIADTAILTYPACFPDSIVGFIPGRRVRIEFVQFWLGFLQEILERTAPESAQKNINLEILRELRCPVPPLPLQEQFATLVARHERLRAVQRESLRQADHLFQSLLHQAFAGCR
jgi:type I restriction enzyme S subunit